MNNLVSLIAAKMNLASLLAEFPGLVNLAHLKDKRATDLTPADVVDIGNAFGVDLPLTAEVQEALLAWLKGANLDTVSDLIQSPESVVQLVSFIRGGLLAIGKPRLDTSKLFLS